MKFDDIKFDQDYLFAKTSSTRGRYIFPNNLSLSIIGGPVYYGNGIDTFEVAIIDSYGKIRYDYEELFQKKFMYYSGIDFYDGDVLRYVTKEQITIIMKWLANYDGD